MILTISKKATMRLGSSVPYARRPCAHDWFGLRHKTASPWQVWCTNLTGRPVVITDPDALRLRFGHHGERYSCPQRAEAMITGADEHRLYQLTPAAIVLFDEANFPEQPRQVVAVPDAAYPATSA
jgi:hypothetical protein